MNNIIFWKYWPNPYRGLITFLTILLLILITGSLFLRIMGLDGLLPWSVMSLESGYSEILKTVSIGAFNFDVLAPKLIITEYFEAGSYPETQWMAKVGLAITALCLSIYLTSISYFSRFWYLVSVAVMMGFVLFLKPESVSLFDLSSRPILIIVFLALFVPSYFIHAFLNDERYGIRLLISLLSVSVLGVLISFSAETADPFSALYSYGLLAPLFVVMLFTITVSHEVIRMFLKVTSINTGSDGKARLRHFLILSLVYWVNVLLSYLEVAHFIDWNYLLFDPYLLLSISTILGLWGINKRAAIYKSASDNAPLWVLIYLSLALIAFALIFYLLLGLNDPILLVIGDFIIYAHVAIGMAFLLYIIYNFMPVIERGYDAEKVLYNPTNLPYFTYRLVGLIGIIGLVAIRGLDYPVWYSMGGYYNSIGDHYRELEEWKFANAYYVQGAEMAMKNHKANYNLARINVSEDKELAKEYYLKTCQTSPSAQAYLNLSNLYHRENEYFKALFQLQEAKIKLPGNEKILNNLAVSFDKGNFLDSAAIYINGLGTGSPIINTNKLGIFAKSGWQLKEDSIELLSKLTVGGIANASNYGIYDFDISSLKGDYMYNRVALNNWLLSEKVSILDSALWQAMAVVDSTRGSDEFKQLRRSLGLSLFRNGGIRMAIERMQSQIYSSLRPRIDDLENLGLLYMSVGEFNQALGPLTQASDRGSVPAKLKIAVCHSELGDLSKAREAWKKISATDDKELNELATRMWYLMADGADIPEGDQDKYFYLRYRSKYLSNQDVLKIIDGIQDPELRVDAWLFVSEYSLRKNEPAAWKASLIKALEGDLDDRQLKQAFMLGALLKIRTGNEVVTYPDDYTFDSDEYLMQILEKNEKDSTDYFHLAFDNPFLVDAVFEAANYYRQDSLSFKPYETLVEALQFNRSSFVLLAEYAKEAAAQGFEDYAATACDQVKELFPDDYPEFRVEYNEFVKNIEQETELD